jgi:hypothetical protein
MSFFPSADGTAQMLDAAASGETAKQATNLYKMATEEADKLQEEIYEIQKKIMSKRVAIQIQIGAFFFTVVVLMFFILIIMRNVIDNLSTYFKKSKLVNRKTKLTKGDENTYHDTILGNENELNTIEREIMKQHASQKEKLKLLTTMKKENDISNHDDIHAQIDLSVLEPVHDDYKYDKNKNGMGFWKMLLMPAKYDQLVKSGAYVKFS